MLIDLGDTRAKKRRTSARKINAIASGVGPIIGIVLPILPFPLHGVVFTLLEAVLVAGIRMGLAGIVVAILNLLLPG